MGCFTPLEACVEASGIMKTSTHGLACQVRSILGPLSKMHGVCSKTWYLPSTSGRQPRATAVTCNIVGVSWTPPPTMYKGAFHACYWGFVRFKVRILKQDIFAYKNPAEMKPFLLMEVWELTYIRLSLRVSCSSFPCDHMETKTSQYSGKREIIRNK